MRRLTVEILPPESPPPFSPEPGARHKSGRRGSEGIAHRPATSTAPSTGWRGASGTVAEQATPRAREGRRMAPRLPGARLAAYESDGPSTYPTPPAAPRKDLCVSDSDSDSEYGHPRRRRPSPPDTRIKNAGHRRRLLASRTPVIRIKLTVHMTTLAGSRCVTIPQESRNPGLQEPEGGQHDDYECFKMRDVLWPSRVRFHFERMRNL